MASDSVNGEFYKWNIVIFAKFNEIGIMIIGRFNTISRDIIN